MKKIILIICLLVLVCGCERASTYDIPNDVLDNAPPVEGYDIPKQDPNVNSNHSNVEIICIDGYKFVLLKGWNGGDDYVDIEQMFFHNGSSLRPIRCKR